MFAPIQSEQNGAYKMKKSEQNAINEKCEREFELAKIAMKKQLDNKGYIDAKRLRTCNAKIFITDDYYILCSYNTYVAVINRNTDTLYDVLRIVYGYTATSAQHIAKFNHDYCENKWGCKERLTAR